MAKAIEQGIRSALVQLDAQLSDINERLDAAKDDENVSTFDVIKDTFTDKKEGALQTKEQLTRAFISSSPTLSHVLKDFVFALADES